MSATATFSRLGLVGLAAAAAMALPATAEVDLSGKTVEWIIPFSETGGS
ncbi:MAG: tricarboxylate transporter, partial [Silicimonas sp.]|nr:tricarboxylate transporter [Silicimonas sp.]